MRKSKQQELNDYIQEMKIVKKTLLEKENKFLKLESYRCITTRGKELHREKLIKNDNDGSAVIILPITEDNEVILIVQPRVFTKSTVGISLPAGYVEKDEKYEEAAIRELVEETGYKPKKIIECCTYYQDDGCSAALNKGFIAFDCIKIGTQNLDKDEFIRIFKCNFQEVEELLNCEMILDSGSQLVLEKFKQYTRK